MKDIFTKHDCLSSQQVQDYLREDLRGEDLYNVENHIADCPLCSAAMDGFTENGFEKEDHNFLKEIEQHVKGHAEQKEAIVKPLRSRLGMLNRIAAAVLVLFIPISMFLYWNNNTTSTDGLYTAYFEGINMNQANRSIEENQMNPLLKNTLHNYQNNNHEASIAGFEQYLETNSENASIELLLGISYLEESYYEKAAKSFNTVRINSERNYEDATWYLALTHLKKEEISSAKDLLDELIQNDVKGNGYYTEKAKELRVKLN